MSVPRGKNISSKVFEKQKKVKNQEIEIKKCCLKTTNGVVGALFIIKKETQQRIIKISSAPSLRERPEITNTDHVQLSPL